MAPGAAPCWGNDGGGDLDGEPRGALLAEQLRAESSAMVVSARGAQSLAGLTGKLDAPVSLPESRAAPRDGGGKRHKWRLCFRVERPGPAEEVNHESQDFFVTVTDPPVGPSAARTMQSFFASDLACQVANLIVGRPLLEQLPGQSLQNKAFCLMGKDGLLAGLVSAMLGAKVALLCHQRLLPHVQQNARTHIKEALDYTHVKSNTVAVMSYSPGRVSSVSGLTLCNELNISPSLTLVVLTESEAASVYSSICGAEEKHWGHDRSRDFVFSVLEELVPPGAPTRVLLVCNRTAGICGRWFEDGGTREEFGGIDDLDIAMDVPLDWTVRPFCGIPGRFVALWLHRSGVEGLRPATGKQLGPLRKYLPPMGASSSRCGCGGHPQRSFLNHSVQNPEWFQNNAKLKEAILAHNRWKLGEAAAVLEEARAWAAAAMATATASCEEAAPEGAAPTEPGEAVALLSTSWVQEADADAQAALGAVQLRAAGRVGRTAAAADALPALSGGSWRQTRSASGGSGSLSARCSGRPKGPDITQRHERPPHFYSCQRAYYSFTP